MLFHNFTPLQRLPVLKPKNPPLCALLNKKIILLIVIFRAYSNQVMYYRLDVSADFLLRRFLFHSKKTKENFNILESRDSTDQKNWPIKKWPISFYKQKLQFYSACPHSSLINIKLHQRHFYQLSNRKRHSSKLWYIRFSVMKTLLLPVHVQPFDHFS